jgi:hypothetical protein
LPKHAKLLEFGWTTSDNFGEAHGTFLPPYLCKLKYLQIEIVYQLGGNQRKEQQFFCKFLHFCLEMSVLMRIGKANSFDQSAEHIYGALKSIAINGPSCRSCKLISSI